MTNLYISKNPFEILDGDDDLVVTTKETKKKKKHYGSGYYPINHTMTKTKTQQQEDSDYIKLLTCPKCQKVIYCQCRCLKGCDRSQIECLCALTSAQKESFKRRGINFSYQSNGFSHLPSEMEHCHRCRRQLYFDQDGYVTYDCQCYPLGHHNQDWSMCQKCSQTQLNCICVNQNPKIIYCGRCGQIDSECVCNRPSSPFRDGDNIVTCYGCGGCGDYCCCWHEEGSYQCPECQTQIFVDSKNIRLNFKCGHNHGHQRCQVIVPYQMTKYDEISQQYIPDKIINCYCNQLYVIDPKGQIIGKLCGH